MRSGRICSLVRQFSCKTSEQLKTGTTSVHGSVPRCKQKCLLILSKGSGVFSFCISSTKTSFKCEDGSLRRAKTDHSDSELSNQCRANLKDASRQNGQSLEDGQVWQWRPRHRKYWRQSVNHGLQYEWRLELPSPLSSSLPAKAQTYWFR